MFTGRGKLTTSRLHVETIQAGIFLDRVANASILSCIPGQRKLMLLEKLSIFASFLL